MSVCLCARAWYFAISDVSFLHSELTLSKLQRAADAHVYTLTHTFNTDADSAARAPSSLHERQVETELVLLMGRH